MAFANFEIRNCATFLSLLHILIYRENDREKKSFTSNNDVNKVCFIW